jgi:hypothetical protein
LPTKRGNGDALSRRAVGLLVGRVGQPRDSGGPVRVFSVRRCQNAGVLVGSESATESAASVRPVRSVAPCHLVTGVSRAAWSGQRAACCGWLLAAPGPAAGQAAGMGLYSHGALASWWRARVAWPFLLAEAMASLEPRRARPTVPGELPTTHSAGPAGPRPTMRRGAAAHD